MYDNYESDSEVDMKDFQYHTIEPFPLYIKEKHCVEMSHPGSVEDIMKHVKEKQPSIDIFVHQLTYVIREGKGVVDQQPTSSFHSPMLSTNIQPYVSSCKVEQDFCYQPSRFYRLFYDPVGLYMELIFQEALEPANIFILSSFGGIVSVPKHVFILLSYFPYHLWIICSEKKSYVTKQSGWLWWKFSFT
jgi:hypothetical protein